MRFAFNFFKSLIALVFYVHLHNLMYECPHKLFDKFLKSN
ncbi:hypothetical protein [uncultured Gammaproteobacteria bacterium]|uniref:Uncharacterized protein n=2 Tax=Bathymodiolus azoricus thioautotrophic gill symbiont TaxID=235205 RepID=A0A1H6LT92_9GAMM|nr:hypothetical protein AZO1586R_27 [Bathymodiolus azoricus thioautotrophic gill symbiont]CAC9450214.1 hypothetical protein [uncultured Gammaproteobacteria bacterium]SHN90246.1 hypothetical protein BCLUESOX_295 [bacterium endosymbiont of Bathymodiolus sp. 5 South]CAC9462189.1 hypothetical protein [uncultured Gammaproteobacteria bacterium]CAC9513688.1 hypothetical protein [uncultured Gammaproteobacteria bacterium]